MTSKITKGTKIRATHKAGRQCGKTGIVKDVARDGRGWIYWVRFNGNAGYRWLTARQMEVR